MDEALLDEVEADVYWCLTKLLDNIQVQPRASFVCWCRRGGSDVIARTASVHLPPLVTDTTYSTRL